MIHCVGTHEEGAKIRGLIRAAEEKTKEIYEQIATRFDHTRAYYWKGIKDFINELPIHSLIFDAGCGNGKHMLLRPDCYFVGQDFWESCPHTLLCYEAREFFCPVLSLLQVERDAP